MKKTFSLALLTALLLCVIWGTAASAEGSLGQVTDSAGILTDEQAQVLESRAKELSQRYNCGIYIVVLRDYREYNSAGVGECAEGLYSYYDLGYGADRDGLLLLLSMDDRDYALTSYGHYADYCFGDHNKNLVESAFLDDFRYDDWAGGFDDYLNLAEDVLLTAETHSLTLSDEDQSFSGVKYPGNSYRYGVSGKLPVPARIAITVLAPCLAALLVCSVFKAQMKTAKLRTTAEEYMVPGSTALRIKEDRFLNRTETRTRIQTDSNRGSGGGGGGGFHTHTGKF